MTTNEKRKKIQEYCHSHICWADPNSKLPECEHKCNRFCSNYSETCASPKTIDEWYKLIFGKDVEDRNEEVAKLRDEIKNLKAELHVVSDKAKCFEDENDYLNREIENLNHTISFLRGVKKTTEAFLGKKIEV